MADTKVSSLSAASALTGTELLYGDDGSADVKITATQVQTFANAGTRTVATGGTGATSLTSHGILQGNGTSAITATAEMSNGQLLVGATGGVAVPRTLTGPVSLTTAGLTAFTETIEVVLDGAGSTLTTAAKMAVHLPYAGTITQGVLLADQSGSVTVDIYKCTYTQYDVSTHPVSGDKITASAPLAISSATKAKDATLTGWTTTFSADDVLLFVVTGSPTSITRVTAALKVTRTS